MKTEITVKTQLGDFDCVAASPDGGARRIVYMIYPDQARFPDGWAEAEAARHGLAIAIVYIPGAGWNDLMTPWPEPGECPGAQPFGGEGPQFLDALRLTIVPAVESALGMNFSGVTRDILGVSLGGLFAFWQWVVDDFFRSVASLSGSFWYAGFDRWFATHTLCPRPGSAYFLLGLAEPLAPTEAYRSVGVNTEAIVRRLKDAGIDTTFEWVKGNHFANPLPRAERALDFLASRADG